MKTKNSKTVLKGKRIIVGVTGGIACYKSCELVRLLIQEGVDVHVVMTSSAKQFVTPMTFQALSCNQVHDDLFNLTQESEMGHITLADSADLMVIAPATANFLAKAAHGLCDDLLSTIVCVTRAPILLAPAMNVHMFENKIVQENLNKLIGLGWQVVGPDSGSLACGYEGHGRMSEPFLIVSAVEELLTRSKKKK
ncbi:MAG: hypothetical protein A3G32_02320 [Deltaproteobacteria bacterium RIFCSPLOWO2_12_FULL_40_28]|nr:MAG: hypothetical protein A3C45_03000 [Deltaproteobacteria bacterium RIFCSPHIGHO2_02_FULL_40_28]OGQ20662.1 MAG: hypothetical protein A3E27_10110 [Deltaproteobacteria bacterium RIFCSPHIGHO2_12_FULL_40_32]OGQ38897.1 MAG: hypothetical protein A3I69_08330 [Deltaproteobacteria bacterium RIFCSPLOWO2_02_FULL_40_36]OGQ55257.1 MAG: hypothetical protein A3G32_02320 [Deltaproteobacteria bacterium RIFCSPLOWO2_12_FULL_40_28]